MVMNLFGKKPATSDLADKVRNGDKVDEKNKSGYREYVVAKQEAGESPVSLADWMAGKR